MTPNRGKTPRRLAAAGQGDLELGDLLHAIDEPAAHAAARIHPLPSVSTGQHAVDIEATRCSLRRCEASLLANCWQAERVPGVVGNRGLLHRS